MTRQTEENRRPSMEKMASVQTTIATEIQEFQLRIMKPGYTIQGGPSVIWTVLAKIRKFS